MKNSKISFIVALSVTLLFMCSCHSLKQVYISEITKEIASDKNNIRGYYTESDFSALPVTVQKYFSNCGYLAKEKTENIRIDYKNAFIKMDTDKKWKKLIIPRLISRKMLHV